MFIILSRSTHFRGFVKQDDIAEFYLLDYQVLDIFLIYVLACQIVSAGKFALHPQCVNYRDYAVQAAYAMFCVSLSESRYHTDGLGYRIRLADSAGLDDDVVEPFHAHQFVDLFNEIGLQCAADASVLPPDCRPFCRRPLLSG